MNNRAMIVFDRQRIGQFKQCLSINSETKLRQMPFDENKRAFRMPHSTW